MKTGLITSDTFQNHDTGPGHPEQIARVTVINENFKKLKNKFLAKDKSGKLVFLADSSFTLEMTKQKYPSLKFHNKSEF